MNLPKIKKRKLGAYPYFSVVISITLTLIVFGVFGYLSIYGLKLITEVKENLQLTVYLKKKSTLSEIEELKRKIIQMPYVVDRQNAVTHTSKDEIANAYFIDTGDDFQNILDNNPFRDYLTITINEIYFDSEKLEEVKKSLLQEEIIFEIQYPKNIVKFVYKNIKNISFISLFFLITLLIINYIQISGAIKLALYSQRFLIRSMQLVGATSSFIKRPFLFRALIHGLLSGIMASLILYFINIVFSTKLYQEVSQYNIFNESMILSLILIIFGALVGIISANFAIKKYLRMSLNQLY